MTLPDWHNYGLTPEPQQKPCEHLTTFLSGWRCVLCGRNLMTGYTNSGEVVVVVEVEK